MASKNGFKIFSANRLSFEQMLSDVMTYIKKVYGNNGEDREFGRTITDFV